jgi:2-polyprenyl-3-methyl-5-hydroxy-6-metoxy-1,4-benzoquinol methylase
MPLTGQERSTSHGGDQASHTPAPHWRVSYPSRCVVYVEAFRRHFWDHQGVCRLLDERFREMGTISSICELGCGAGTNLIHLATLGYECFGYDVSAESLDIAQAAALNAGVKVHFSQLDFFEVLPDRQFDAVVALFVPISLADMEQLARRVAPLVRPGGLFACMLLAVQPEFRDQVAAKRQSAEYLQILGKDVLRQNFYRKEGNLIHYEGVYFIGDEESVRMAVDRDTYDLVVDDAKLNPPGHMFKQQSRQRIIGKPEQCPPMTFEILDIFQKL